jgi:hypothetical protein
MAKSDDLKVGKLGLVDALVIGAAKTATDSVFQRVSPVGNGNMMSGVVKIVGAIGLGMVSNRWTRDIATGVGLDGVEDILAVGKTMLMGKANSNGGIIVV